MDWGILLLALSLPVLAASSAFFSAGETAIFSLSAHQRRQLLRIRGVAGPALSQLLDESRHLLFTLLLGNMLINMLYFVLGTLLLLRMESQFSPGVIGVISALQLLMLILFAEVGPKLVAARNNMLVSKLLAAPLLMVHRAVTPARLVLSQGIILPLSRLLAPSQAPPSLSSEELELLVEHSRAKGVIDPGEEELLGRVLSLNQYKVRDIMVPRVDMVGLNLEDPPTHYLKLIRDAGQRRIIVYEGDLDHIVGVLYARQALITHPTTRKQIEAMIRQVPFVPEIQRVDQLLLQFRKRGTTLAVAVDEYGGTSGLVTLEFIAELMVGEIAGPDDKPTEPPFSLIGPGTWRVSADISVEEWEGMFGEPGDHPGVSTAAGLVMSQLGRLAHVGDKAELGMMQVEVSAMRGKRLTWLTVRSKPEAPSPESPESSPEAAS